MRKSEINGIINDLLNYMCCDNPLDRSDNIGNIEVNLLKKEIDYPLPDGVYDFYKKKMEWFNERIDRFGGRPGFQIAKIFVSGRTERVEIVFMNDTFLGELKHDSVINNLKGTFDSMNLKKAINELAPCADMSKSEVEPIKPAEEIKESTEIIEENKHKKRGKKK